MGRLLGALLALVLLFPPELRAVVAVSVNVPVGGVPVAAQAGAAVGTLSRGPGSPISLDFGLEVPQLEPIYSAASQQLINRLDAVANIPPGGETFDNTLMAVEHAYADYFEAMRPITFSISVSPDAALRAAADALSGRASDMLVEQSLREDIYNVVKSYADKGEKLEGERKRLLDATMRGYRKSGMALSRADRRRFKKLQKRLLELKKKFRATLREWDDAIAAKPEDLAGLPSPFIDSLDRLPGGLVRVPTESTVYGQVMRKAHSAKLRRRLYLRKQREAAKENLPVLKKALKVRHEMATLLGYKNYAESALDGRMAKTPARVWKFLNRLRDMLLDTARKETDEVLRRKQRDKPNATKLYPWDYSYYGSKLFEETLDLEADEVRKYFPVSRVVKETLKFYEELLGLKFRKIKVKTWHPDVKAYEIRDAATGERIGRFYLDLHPRPGKRGGAAAFPLVVGRELADGSYREPESAIVANFAKPLPGKPALMRHGNVKTFFHEFGHVMHQTLTTAKIWSFSGSSTAQDFVEAPSQMMENFIWQPKILNRISGHYRNHSKKIPPDLMKKLLDTRQYHSASGTLGQAAMAALDLAYHSYAPVDVLDVFRKIEKAYTGEAPYRSSKYPARFGHIMGGYAAGYYGYLWSRVFAQDIFSVFEAAAEGLISPRVGLRYRGTILENGSTLDEDVLLRNFLGREPNELAFLKWLGFKSLPKDDTPRGIEELTLADVDDIVEMENLSFNERDAWTLDHYRDVLISGEDDGAEDIRILGVRKRGRLAANIMFGRYPGHELGPSMHIIGVTSHPDFRGKGLAKKLMREALRRARKDPRVTAVTAEIRLSNTASRALFKRMGFREVGILKDYYGDEDGVMVVLPLTQTLAKS